MTTTVPEEECDHMAWWQLNAKWGCIHPSHGPWPRPLDAACRGMANLMFFPTRGHDANDAKKVCAACPVRNTCLTVALTGKDRHGIHGSTTEKERRILLRRVAAGEAVEAVADSWEPRIKYGWTPSSPASERYAKAWALRAGRQRVAAA